jgi:ATP-dependent Lon protease
MSSPDTEFIRILGAVSDATAAAEPRPAPKPAPEELPVLGLADVVVFPGMIAPLLVDTAPSIQLIDDVVEGDRLLALVLQRRPDLEEPRPEDLWDHGCGARVLKMLKIPDGTVRILVEGLWRVRILEYQTQTPYLRAKIQMLPELVDDSVELIALTRHAQAQFQEVTKLTPALSEQVKIAAFNTEDPARFSDLIAANLNLPLEERQRLLEINDVKQRLQRLLPLLDRELQVLALSTKIQNEVTATLTKSQRDFYLREQMRAIQRELGESDPVTAEVNALREQLDKDALPEEPRAVVLKELERLQQMSPAMAEFALTRNYIDWLLNLPWTKTTPDTLDLEAARRILEDQHYGLDKVKERLLEFIAVIKLKKNLKGPILCLVGPPGVGKTSLGRSVAEALGRKFARLSLGGLRDEAEIRGHRRTYVGALPGRIIQTLRRVGSRNPVLMLDELDKVGADFRGDPSAALLEVLDPEQNSAFVDHYLDVPFDLSGVLFIATANWLDPVHPALRDRLEVIELPSYTPEEKLQIARRYLVPRQLQEHGLRRQQVRLPAPTLRRLILDYTHEAGVRQLEREVASLIRKAACRILSGQATNGTVTIPAAALPSYLGSPRYLAQTRERITEFGIAIGLAWTPVGGEILFVEATRMPGKGQLLLTGSLGEVMKESAQTALSYLRSQARRLHIDLSDFDKTDLHIHVPAGATPKDGPSAGVTIVVALASLLTRRLVRSDLAMTGEISLRGRVLRVGGIKEKALAALRSGIHQLILPEQNRADWNEVPAEVRRRLKVHFVRHIDQLLPLALQPR